MSDPWEHREKAIVELKNKIKENYDDKNENVLNELKKWIEEKKFDYNDNQLTDVINAEIEKQNLKFEQGKKRPSRTYTEVYNNNFINPTPPSLGPNRTAIRAGKRTRKHKNKKRRARSHKRR